MKNNSLEARVADLCERAGRTYVPTFTAFLTPEEQTAAKKEAEHYTDLFSLAFGGFADAERNVLGFYARDIYAEPVDSAALYAEYAAQAGLVCLYIRGSGFASFDHRAVLGSLMALGLKREAIGDIYVTDSAKEAYVITLETVAPFIAEGLQTVGRDTVKVKRVTSDALPEQTKRFCDLSLTLASIRMDALLSDALNLSRENAKKLIHSGRVSLNHAECTATDKPFSVGDRISVKGYGKFYIESFQGKTQKDRFRVIVRKYL